MKQIINDKVDLIQEMTQGIEFASNFKLKKVNQSNILITAKPNPTKVSLISGGGSGHEPSHAGFVGDGMLDGAVCGEVFSSPTPFDVFEAIKSVNNTQGVLLIVKNYSGDIMNFTMACDMANEAGIKTDYIVVDDDIAVKDSLYTQGRRGIAGTVLVHKVLGYLAKQGSSLAELKEFGTKLIKHIKTIGIGLHACTLPTTGKASFEVKDDEIEFGCGIHGEPGVKVEKHVSAKEYAQKMLASLDAELKFDTKKEYILLINGFGRTTLLEQYIFTNAVVSQLSAKKIKIVQVKVGNYMTSLDMSGLSLTVLEVFDKQIMTAITSSVDILGNLF
ncbi:dihydroxyacetone kinase [Spiroplasma clarkii]|uniref:Dihydroxyacetone kinase, N-terminal domain n=1 Tax=Spiroplasma clarkii TaxID=2139 RepID=A0A1Y0L164_9MOLU|nr:dihydroxyacetone kinase subunit DhaK [Spiroplasma clarkii]ARU91726.1 dihydroxyacetone kinase [Spiroplasma clarkii]ATX71109.1 dihydroxyacetone kinase, N-terminal domain [Spiroplasma clarkii]